jgi:hypothetical protein
VTQREIRWKRKRNFSRGQDGSRNANFPAGGFLAGLELVVGAGEEGGPEGGGSFPAAERSPVLF